MRGDRTNRTAGRSVLRRRRLPWLRVGAAALGYGCAGLGTEDSGAVRIEIDTVGTTELVRSLGEAPEWPVTELFSIGGIGATSPAEEFAQVGTIAVDGEGRLYTADTGARAVQVFDSSGAWLRTIGRTGQGPGEYVRPYAIGLLGDTLVVVDPQNLRMGLFDPEGRWLGQLPYPPISGSNRVFQLGADRIAVLDMRRLDSGIETTYVTWTHGGPRDTVAAAAPRPPRGEGPAVSLECPDDATGIIHLYGSSFAPRAVRSPAPGGLAVESAPAGYRILLLTATGDTIRVVQKGADEDAALSDADWEREMARLDAFLADIPGVTCTPARPERTRLKRRVGEIFHDPAGRMWVERWAEPEDTLSVYDVFTPEGALTGTVRVLRRSRQAHQPVVWRDRLYLVTADELGVQSVRAYRFEEG